VGLCCDGVCMVFMLRLQLERVSMSAEKNFQRESLTFLFAF